MFDPHGNDIGTYQARELSYLFDAVDARVLEVLLARSVPFFVPLSALLASFLTTIVFFVGSGKVAPQLRPLMATLILLLYLSNHVYVVTTAVYYRSTKPLLAPVLLIALFYLTHVLRQAPRPAPQSPRVSGPFVVVCALGCTMSLLDRQGFFYAVIMLAGLTLWYRARGGRRDLLHGSIAAIALMMLYNFLLAPFIVKQVNGYWSSFEYQKLDALHLIAAVVGRLHGASAVAVNAVLVVLIVGNILGWPAYRRVMLASKWLPGVHAQSALLKQSFEQQRPADDLTPDYRALYDFFRARPAGAAAR